MEAARRIARSRWLPMGASLVLIAAVAWWIARQEPPRLPSGTAAALYLLLAVAVYAGATVARAERWRRLLAACDVAASPSDAYKLTPVGYMGNNILPARAGELLRVVLLAPRAGTSKTRVLGTIVAERVLDAIALCALFFACVVSIGTAAGAVGAACVAALALAICAGALVVVHAGRLANRGGRPPRTTLERLLRQLGELTRPLRRMPRGLGMRMIALSFLVWSAEATLYLLVADAVGIELSVLQAVSVMVVANLASLIPAGPGYLGTFDAAVLGSLQALGVAHAASSGYLLILRFVLFVPITIVGLVLFVGAYAGLERLRRMPLRAEEA